MREFYIENELGQRKSLSGGDAWLTNPQGLGVNLSENHADLGGGFYMEISPEDIPRQPIIGDLVFTRGAEAYRKYRVLSDFMLKAGRLNLVYKPYGNEEYFRGVSLEYLNKGELGAGKFLTVPVSFRPLTPWYKKTPTRSAINFAEDEENAKRYPHDYPYKYIDRVASAESEVVANGHTPAGLVFTYSGALENPSLILYGNQSGKTYGNLAVNLVTNDGDTFEYSSRYDESYVRLRQASGAVVDLIDLIDITKDVFFRVPLDEKCVFVVTSDNKMTGNAQIAVFDYYKTV